jgi:hypothetical protein
MKPSLPTTFEEMDMARSGLSDGEWVLTGQTPDSMLAVTPPNEGKSYRCCL